jgi:hypothetical protein
MDAPGLSQRCRAVLALVVAVCLSFSAATAVVWECWPAARAVSESFPQLSASSHASTPAVAEGTRKGSADCLNILPQSALQARLTRLVAGADDSTAALDFLPGAPGKAIFAESPIRAPPDPLV